MIRLYRLKNAQCKQNNLRYILLHQLKNKNLKSAMAIKNVDFKWQNSYDLGRSLLLEVLKISTFVPVNYTF